MIGNRPAEGHDKSTSVEKDNTVLLQLYTEPGYDVLVVTPVSRTVSPLEKGLDIFTCYP